MSPHTHTHNIVVSQKHYFLFGSLLVQSVTKLSNLIGIVPNKTIYHTVIPIALMYSIPKGLSNWLPLVCVHHKISNIRHLTTMEKAFVVLWSHT